MMWIHQSRPGKKQQTGISTPMYPAAATASVTPTTRNARPARQTFKTARCKTPQIRILHLTHGALFLPDLDFTLVKCVFACKGGAFQSGKRAAIVQALQATFGKPNRKALKDSSEELCGSLPERLWRTPGRSFAEAFQKGFGGLLGRSLGTAFQSTWSNRRDFDFSIFESPLKRHSVARNSEFKCSMDRIHFNFGNYTWFTALCAALARRKSQLLSLNGGPEFPRTPSSQCCLRVTQAYRTWRWGPQHCNGGLQRGGDPEIAHARCSYIWSNFKCGRRKCRRLEERL